MSSYEKIKEIYNQQRVDYFAMACSYYFQIGHSSAWDISEEDIAKAEENGLMTKEFVQNLMKTARDIAKASESSIDLVQFCMAEDIFDVRLYANKIPRYKLEEMIKSGIYNDNYDFTKVKDVEEACDKYECDAEDFESLGYEITEEYYE